MGCFEIKSDAGGSPHRGYGYSRAFWLAFAAIVSVPARAPAAAAPAATAPSATSSSTTKPNQAPNATPAVAAQKPAPVQHFDIDDFAVVGADKLPEIDLDEAIYPYLGPNKTAADVEKARAALEKAYHDKGFQTVSVAVPEQDAQRKVITLKVTEMKVGRLRVKNSRYFDLDKIKTRAASLQEGTVPNFNDVTKDITGLNQCRIGR